MIIPLTPILAREFGAGGFKVGLLISSYSIAQFLFCAFLGPFKRYFWPKGCHFNRALRLLSGLCDFRFFRLF